MAWLIQRPWSLWAWGCVGFSRGLLPGCGETLRGLELEAAHLLPAVWTSMVPLRGSEVSFPCERSFLEKLQAHV